MEFSVDGFNDLLAEMGQRVAWRRAEFCPCRDPNSDAALQGCKICAGLGTFWNAPVIAWAGMTGQKIARAWQQSGTYESGDIVNTIGSDSPMYAAGEHDRVQMLDSTEPFHSIFTHDGTDKVLFFIREIDRVFSVDQTTAAIYDYGIPIVNDDGTFNFINNPPPAGIQYSMRGRRRPEFFIFQDFPQDRPHFNGLPLPRRVVLRKFDLYGRQRTAM